MCYYKSEFPLPHVHNAFLIHFPSIVRENLILISYYGLDDLVDIGLESDLIPVWWNRDQGGAEADGKIVRVHHVLI